MYVDKIEWPEKHKCSAIITVNLSAEHFWLQVDPKAIDMPNTLSMGEYGITIGLERVLSVLDSFDIKATFFVPGKVAETYPDHISKVIEKGHEIACMGYSHENYGVLEVSEQRLFMEKAVKSIQDNCGINPQGFRAPMGDLTMDTLSIVKELGMVYSSNLSDDDRPYWKELENKKDRILEIPIHYALYDLPYFALNYVPPFPIGWCRISGYSGVLNNWKDEFAAYYDYGLCYVLQIDPQTIGNPGRIGILEELFEYIKSMTHLGTTWLATGTQMAKYFTKK